jgi:hypothetical protein
MEESTGGFRGREGSVGGCAIAPAGAVVIGVIGLEEIRAKVEFPAENKCLTKNLSGL